MTVAQQDFEILLTALEVTGLDEVVLDPNADLTIFAPTDDAFVRLAQDLGGDVADGDEEAALSFILATLDALDTEGDGTGLLADILTYHVSAEAKTLRDVAAEGTIETLNGADFGVDVANRSASDDEPDIADPALVDGAGNIRFGDSVIHGIDGVLLPFDLDGNSPEDSIADIVVAVSSAEGPDSNGGDFDILLAALQATGLDAVAADDAQDLTVFAPTDAAFVNLVQSLGFDIEDTDEAGALDGLLQALDFADRDGDGLDILSDILLYHIAAGDPTLADIQDDRVVETLLGKRFVVTGNQIRDREPELENAEFVDGLTDIQASNGAVQAIDQVLIPFDLPLTAFDEFNFV